MSNTQGGAILLFAAGLWLWPHFSRWLSSGPGHRRHGGGNRHDRFDGRH